MVAVELSKIVVVTINVIFLIFGLAVLIIGIIFKVGWDDVREVFENAAESVNFDLQAAGDILGYAGIIFGSFIIIVALLGCIGACCKLRLLLVLYAIILIILIAGECAIVGLVATHADEAKEDVGKQMDKTLNGNYYENSTNSMSRAYSALFSKLECCGVYNYTFSFHAAPEREHNPKIPSTIPITCCKSFNYKDKLSDKSYQDKAIEDCLISHSDQATYLKGCLDTIIDDVKNHKGILIGVGVAILVLELIMVILAFVLCCRGDKD